MEIICPICKKYLHRDEHRFYCENNHSFDIAKEGYVNLAMTKTVDSGDSKESIVARSSFLAQDHYQFLKSAMNDYIQKYQVEKLTDLACGEGYYTKDLKAKTKIGIDLSKKGLKTASKKDHDTTYILASIFHSPIQDESQDMVITCFAPIAAQEIARILKKDGIFLLVKPAKDHLYELKKAIYDEPYYNQETISEIEGMTLIDHQIIKKTCQLNKTDMVNLFMMTPYFYKTSLKDKEKLDQLATIDITFAFDLSLYQKDSI